MVSTPLKHFSKFGLLLPIYGKIKCSKPPTSIYIWDIMGYTDNAYITRNVMPLRLKKGEILPQLWDILMGISTGKHEIEREWCFFGHHSGLTLAFHFTDSWGIFNSHVICDKSHGNPMAFLDSMEIMWLSEFTTHPHRSSYMHRKTNTFLSPNKSTKFTHPPKKSSFHHYHLFLQVI